jgi:hypothetical protein
MPCCTRRAGDVARVRALALQARFLRAEAMTLHQAGDYSAAVTCLLRPPRCSVDRVLTECGCTYDSMYNQWAST